MEQQEVYVVVETAPNDALVIVSVCGSEDTAFEKCDERVKSYGPGEFEALELALEVRKYKVNP